MRQIQKKSGSVYADQNAWDILKKEVLELQPSKVFCIDGWAHARILYPMVYPKKWDRKPHNPFNTRWGRK